MTIETYKRNLLEIIESLIEKCKENSLEEQITAFETVKHLILRDVINDKAGERTQISRDLTNPITGEIKHFFCDNFELAGEIDEMLLECITFGAQKLGLGSFNFFRLLQFKVFEFIEDLLSKSTEKQEELKLNDKNLKIPNETFPGVK